MLLFFLSVIGFLYLPCFSQAFTQSHSPLTLDYVNDAPRLLFVMQNRSSGSSFSQVDKSKLLHKAMSVKAMIQRSWITSMVVPGLGQVYNKDYWKVPCIYLGFILVGSRIYLEHQEMNHYKRILLVVDNDKPNPAFTEKRIEECERTRNLFIIIASAWYLLNILDAYAKGHNKTFNMKHGIDTLPNSKSTVLSQTTTSALMG